MKRYVRTICGLVMAAVLLSACTSGTESDSSSTSDMTTVTGESLLSPAAAVLPPAPPITNDLAQGSAHRSIEVPGETFELSVDYWITTDPAAWTTLNAKTVYSSTHTTPVADSVQPTILVEYTETTALIRSTDVDLDGQEIANHRDSPATGALPGYVVDSNLPYEGLFSIDARSQQILGRWSELGRPGPVSTAELAAAGVYANEITVTYSLLIRGATETDSAAWHRRLVQDTITVGTPNG